MKPGNQWTPAVDTAQCSNPLLSTTEECTAANTWTDTVPALLNDSLTGWAKRSAVCRHMERCYAEGEKCANDRASESECAAPNIWREPLWQSFCRVDPDTPAAATLTCSTASNSRVSACAIGYTKDGSGNADTCVLNTCTALGGSVPAGYTVATASATSTAALGAIGCAYGYREDGTPRAECPTSEAFVLKGCIEDACSQRRPNQLRKRCVWHVRVGVPPAEVPACAWSPDRGRLPHSGQRRLWRDFYCDGAYSRLGLCPGILQGRRNPGIVLG